ncbi:retrovirus-related pol polyprotein from transposon TNT 1-94 [Tanacetum coccineum]
MGKRRKAKSPLRLIDEPNDKGVPVEEPAHDDEEADHQRALELSLKEQEERTQGPAHPVVLKEPDSEKFQPLPEVQGKGKEKVIEEQDAHDLLTLQTPKKKSPIEQFIFQSEIESDEEASKINARNQKEGQARPNPGVQDEGQAGPNPGVQDEGQARPNPGIAVESQLQSSHVVHAGPNLEHMDLGTSDASTQQKHKQMDEEFTTTAYPNVQENLKLPTEDQEEEPGKTNADNLENLNLPHKVGQAVDEIVTNAMFEDDSYKAHTIHNDMYEALQKLLELDYSNQRLADQDEARASSALGTLGASRSSQLPPTPPPTSTGTSGSAQQ